MSSIKSCKLPTTSRNDRQQIKTKEINLLIICKNLLACCLDCSISFYQCPNLSLPSTSFNYHSIILEKAILSFKIALQIQCRHSSRNLAHGFWNFWYLIEVQTILEKCVVFFFTQKVFDCKKCICTVFVMQSLICYCFFQDDGMVI